MPMDTFAGVSETIRFPASRRHLWDRTTRGAPVVLRYEALFTISQARDYELAAGLRGSSRPLGFKVAACDCCMSMPTAGSSRCVLG